MPPALSGGAVSSGGSSVSVTQYTEVTNDSLLFRRATWERLKSRLSACPSRCTRAQTAPYLPRARATLRAPAFGTANVCIAGHNRGVRDDFGDLHTLEPGDTVTWSTKLGTRIYERWSSVQKGAGDQHQRRRIHRGQPDDPVYLCPKRKRLPLAGPGCGSSE